MLVLHLILAVAVAAMFMSRKSQDPSSEERYAMASREWEKLPADYTRVIQLHRRYIRGELYSTPFYGGLLDAETDSLREHLLRFHDFRLGTTSSQPFEQVTEPEKGGFGMAVAPSQSRMGFPNGDNVHTLFFFYPPRKSIIEHVRISRLVCWVERGYTPPTFCRRIAKPFRVIFPPNLTQ